MLPAPPGPATAHRTRTAATPAAKAPPRTEARRPVQSPRAAGAAQQRLVAEQLTSQAVRRPPAWAHRRREQTARVPRQAAPTTPPGTPGRQRSAATQLTHVTVQPLTTPTRRHSKQPAQVPRPPAPPEGTQQHLAARQLVYPAGWAPPAVRTRARLPARALRPGTYSRTGPRPGARVRRQARAAHRKSRALQGGRVRAAGPAPAASPRASPEAWVQRRRAPGCRSTAGRSWSGGPAEERAGAPTGDRPPRMQRATGPATAPAPAVQRPGRWPGGPAPRAQRSPPYAAPVPSPTTAEPRQHQQPRPQTPRAQHPHPQAIHAPNPHQPPRAHPTPTPSHRNAKSPHPQAHPNRHHQLHPPRRPPHPPHPVHPNPRAPQAEASPKLPAA